MTRISLTDEFPSQWLEAAEQSPLVRLHLFGGVSELPSSEIETFVTNMVDQVNASGLKCDFIGAVKAGKAFPQVGFKVENVQTGNELAAFLKGFVKGRLPDQGYSLSKPS